MLENCLAGEIQRLHSPRQVHCLPKESQRVHFCLQVAGQFVERLQIEWRLLVYWSFF